MTSLGTANCRSKKNLCFYINATPHLQVIKITNIPGFYFERIVFPGQRLLFEASPAAQLMVLTSAMADTMMTNTVSCRQLQVKGFA